jgi:hypothetical protein
LALFQGSVVVPVVDCLDPVFLSLDELLCLFFGDDKVDFKLQLLLLLGLDVVQQCLGVFF